MQQTSGPLLPNRRNSDGDNKKNNNSNNNNNNNNFTRDNYVARLTYVCFIPGKGLIRDLSANSSNIASEVPLASK